MKRPKRSKATKKNTVGKANPVNGISVVLEKKQKSFKASLCKWIRWLIGAVIACFSLLQIYDYCYPNPSVEVVDDDYDSPISATLSIINNSKLFPMESVRLSCTISGHITGIGSINNERVDSNVDDTVVAGGNIKPKCNIDGKYELHYSELNVDISYRITWLKRFFSQTFTWNNKTKKWTKGPFAKLLQ